MKLLALRVAAFGRFSEPVAIEGLGDGINVLSGPNEMGKSTLFRALEAAFLLRHKVTGTALEAMRPYGGGEPLVEVEFEAEGRRWRLRKQFGRGAAAALTDAAAGRDVARNAEAEERLAVLTGRTGDLPGAIGLVWVRQQRSLLPPDPDLDPESGKEKPRGERAALREIIGRDIEAVAAGDVFEGVLDRTKRALDALLTPTRTAIKKGSPLEEAQRRRDETRAKRDEARSVAQAAERRLAEIAAISARLAELASPATSDAAGPRVSDLEARRAAALDARVRRDIARETMKAREAQHGAAIETLASRQKLVESLAAKRSAQAMAQKYSGMIETLVAAINADPVTPALIERLAIVDRERAVAEAEIRGHATTVDLRLEQGGRGKLSVDGRPLTESGHLAVVEPIEIVIEGIAAIRISAAKPERGAELKTKSTAAGAEIAETLDRLGAATIEVARQRAAVRAANVAGLEGARAHLFELAPQGLQKLAEEVANLEAALKIAEQHSVSDETVARLRSEAAEARATFDALNGRAISDDDLRKLESQIVSARKDQENREAEIKRLTGDLAHAKGAQQGIDETGRASEVAALEGELERAEAEVQRLRLEAEALRLLETTLTGIEARTRTAYFAPISRRLGGHLERVFGSSTLSFKDDFAVDALERSGRSEEVGRLSDGTREQLGILVRLAFAEVLAESGKPVPLVLDDPLVYADDARLAAICNELAAAKTVPQLLVLTCREKAFQILPGRRLTVTNWRPERP